MATQTKHLKLVKPNQSSQFKTADIAENWEKIDRAPGRFICTSTSRPSLAANQAGMGIYETDTRLGWVWNGSAWDREAPVGLLRTTSGSWAHGTRTTDFQTNSTTPVLVMGVQNVVVPPGNRTLQVIFSYSRAYSSQGYFYGRLYRSFTANSGPIERQWAINGDRGTELLASRGGGGTFITTIRGGLPAGVYSWSIQVFSNPSTPTNLATITGTPAYPNELTVVEL